MQWSDINRAPSVKTLRQFGGLGLLVFGCLACWQGLRLGHGRAAAILAALAFVFGALGLVRPQSLKWVYVAWMVAAFPIGWAVSRLMLAILYFGVFTPIAVIFRVIGRDELHRRRRPQHDSCWVPKAMAADPRSYFRQA
jgi:hypothetical protein